MLCLEEPADARVPRNVNLRRDGLSRSRGVPLPKLGHDLLGILVEDGDLVVLTQEREGVDHRHEVVAGAPGLRNDVPSRTWRFGAKDDAFDTTLPDRRLEEDRVVRAGI